MVLRPILDNECPDDSNFVPAWTAVERQQKKHAVSWWLITQPDHAVLSGQIAAHWATPGVPAEIVHAIGVHDAGWQLFESDGHAPWVHTDGSPVSFFEVSPEKFLRAWTASVDRAEEDSAAGGYVVSQHFCRLGEYRLGRDEDPPQIRQQISAFLAAERERQIALKRSQPKKPDWDSFLPFLQFCDILSLYLCSGTRQGVEFPQNFSRRNVRAHWKGEVVVLDPTPLKSRLNVAVAVRRYPAAPPDMTSIQVVVE